MSEQSEQAAWNRGFSAGRFSWLRGIPDPATVERLTLRPGDRLVLNHKNRLTDVEYIKVIKYIEEHWGLPDGVKVIIMDGGDSLQVLAREEDK